MMCSYMEHHELQPKNKWHLKELVCEKIYGKFSKGGKMRRAETEPQIVVIFLTYINVLFRRSKEKKTTEKIKQVTRDPSI